MLTAGTLSARDVGQAGSTGSCKELEQIATVETSSPAEAVRLLEDAAQRVGPTCVGTILTSMAQAASLDGRLGDVAQYAERSVKFLEAEHSPEDPILMRPLALGSAANFELNNRTKSRRLLDRMRLIRPQDSEQKALVHSLSARLLRAEGRLQEAEDEMRGALLDQSAAGELTSANQVWLLHQLACIYIEQQRYPDARAMVERAGAIVGRSKEALPLDRFRIHELAGIVAAREGKWQQSEKDFAKALEIADATPTFDGMMTRNLLANYVVVMKKAGRGRAAKAVEKRLSEMPSNPGANAIVDVKDLARQPAE